MSDESLCELRTGSGTSAGLPPLNSHNSPTRCKLSSAPFHSWQSPGPEGCGGLHGVTQLLGGLRGTQIWVCLAPQTGFNHCWIPHCPGPSSPGISYIFAECLRLRFQVMAPYLVLWRCRPCS